MLKIAVRVDASPVIGAGHFMRCLALIRGMIQVTSQQKIPLQVTFICAEITELCKAQLLNCNLNFVKISLIGDCETITEDANLTAKALEKIGKLHLLIVDSYKIQAPWYNEEIRAWTQKTLVIDDLANRPHLCDYLLDQTLNSSQQRYTELVPPSCKLLIGKPYMLLREEYFQRRKDALEKRKNTRSISNVLISMGGSDPQSLNLIAIDAIRHIRDRFEHEVNATLVVPSSTQSLPRYQALSAKYSWLEIITDASHMAELIYSADLAIGASGSSAWERCCLGLPTLSIELAENQSLVLEQLSSQGAIINLGSYKQITVSSLQESLTEVIDSAELYQSLASNAAECCDGRGVIRALQQLKLSSVYLRKATVHDRDLLYDWQSQKVVRQYARTNHQISFSEHCAWYEKTMNDNSRHMFIITEKWVNGSECPVGMLRLDKLNDSYEISILVCPSQHGRGIALQALNAIPDEFKTIPITATVHPDNLASQALFTKAGFDKVSDDLFILR